MAFRWIVEPVVAVAGRRDDGTFIRARDTDIADAFMPLSATTFDPGFAHRQTYSHCSIVDHPPGVRRLADWPNPVALSLICFRDFSALAADAAITDVLDEEYADDQHPRFIVDHSPATRNWPRARRDRLREELQSRRADLTDLDDAKPFWMHLERLARRIHGRRGPDPRKLMTSLS